MGCLHSTPSETSSDGSSTVEACISKLGDACSIGELQRALTTSEILFDEARFEIAMHAFGAGGTISCAALLHRGFVHFFARTTSQHLFVGQCVSFGPQGDVGVIQTNDGGAFSIAVPKGKGIEVKSEVKAKELVPCTNLDKTQKTTQTNYLQALEERVGPKSGRDWQAQVPMVIKEDWLNRFDKSQHKPEKLSAELAKHEKQLATMHWASSFDAYCKHVEHKPAIEQISKAGEWNMEDAGVIAFCLNYSHVLAASVSDSRDSYGALLHKYYDMMAKRAERKPSNRRFKSEAVKVAPNSFRHLRGGLNGRQGGTGLADIEAGWADILDGDPRGFRGFTSHGITVTGPGKCRDVAPGGFRVADWTNSQKQVVDSPVVCFRSKEQDKSGLHTAVWTDQSNLVFPPMTLFKVVDVKEKGWEFDGTDALVERCQWLWKEAPTPERDEWGRNCITRTALEAWLRERHPEVLPPEVLPTADKEEAIPSQLSRAASFTFINPEETVSHAPPQRQHVAPQPMMMMQQAAPQPMMMIQQAAPQPMMMMQQAAPQPMMMIQQAAPQRMASFTFISPLEEAPESPMLSKEALQSHNKDTQGGVMMQSECSVASVVTSSDDGEEPSQARVMMESEYSESEYYGSDDDEKAPSSKGWKGSQSPATQIAKGFDWIDQNMLPVDADSTIYRVQQQLIVVEATYLLPLASTGTTAAQQQPGMAAAGADAAAPGAERYGYSQASAKLCETAVTLRYLAREAYIRGLSEVLFCPPCTMEEEWMRDDRWEDWSGRCFSAATEYQYVVGGCAEEESTPVGSHELGHGGWDLGRFRVHINGIIRSHLGAASRAEDELSREEVIACRLYTGPGYQKLNGEFLREVGSVDSREWRQRLAQVPSYTYSATVTHLVNAIRKLCRVKLRDAGASGSGAEIETETETLLYRSVSGKLPDSFFEPDAQGMITAVDPGMMSTSMERETPMRYIKNGIGVLFVLHCTAATEGTGEQHMGALLQPISQYPAEAEILFPPLTLLSVMKDEKGDFMIHEAQEDGKLIKEIHVAPSFV